MSGARLGHAARTLADTLPTHPLATVARAALKEVTRTGQPSVPGFTFQEWAGRRSIDIPREAPVR